VFDGSNNKWLAVLMLRNRQCNGSGHNRQHIIVAAELQAQVAVGVNMKI